MKSLSASEHFPLILILKGREEGPNVLYRGGFLKKQTGTFFSPVLCEIFLIYSLYQMILFHKYQTHLSGMVQRQLVGLQTSSGESKRGF